MNSFQVDMDDMTPWLIAGLGGVVACVALYKLTKRSEKKTLAPPNTVVLYQFPRGPAVPSISPFAIKLETFLRMAKIPHQSDVSLKWSSKGKLPWIEYNGQEVEDSQFCIEFLKKELGIDLNKHLSTQDKAIARAFQEMAEENLYWTMVAERWLYSMDFAEKTFFYGAGFFKRLIMRCSLKCRQNILKEELWGQGMGRHTKEQIHSIAVGDLKAISDFLGEKKFLFGDEPCEEDCAIFGMLAQAYWQSPDTQFGVFIAKHPNLCAYCERMKTTFWPDWDEYNTDWGKRKTFK